MAVSQAMSRARFRVRGDTLELQPASEETLIRVEFFGDEVERITELDPLTGELLAERKEVNVYPATHYVTPGDKLKEAIVDIEVEMEERVGQLEAEGRARVRAAERSVRTRQSRSATSTWNRPHAANTTVVGAGAASAERLG